MLMGKQIIITGITGSSPFDIYLCQSNNTDCIYIDRTSNTSYSFIIPPPYDTADSYVLKIVDSNGCTIAEQS